MVVINGDRASWIRAGVDYFPKAIYQVDRFHVKRDLRRLLCETGELGVCLGAFDRNDIDALCLEDLQVPGGRWRAHRRLSAAKLQ